ncbi:hypothetical protein HJG54_02090 [Leptolyngbya sp. NK1-12]|uniref:Uncharacterized protein n=1 Tax=Leptolyngbya sp. NK1-12 TaxID=2547451 RepID=A0AA96WI65_9CYAN|nr:hypothetical protein [Leptolyngbya sp. NK1-12]WNZ21776.1 hypothetical protein HJG54_02090 [Leptolyngbya sp. NK1-12]
MYIISVDHQDWLVGDSKGWLTTTPLRSLAAVYLTLSAAQEAVAYYASSYTNVTFAIYPLDGQAPILDESTASDLLLNNSMIDGSTMMSAR